MLQEKHKESHHNPTPEELRKKRHDEFKERQKSKRTFTREGFEDYRDSHEEDKIDIAKAFQEKDRDALFLIFEGSKNNEELFEELKTYLKQNFTKETINNICVNDENTLLTFAAIFNHQKLIGFLLDLGASPDVPDSRGLLPLQLIISSNFFEDQEELQPALLLLKRTALTKEIVDKVVDCIQNQLQDEYSDVLLDFYYEHLSAIFKRFNPGQKLPNFEDQIEDPEVDKLAEMFVGAAAAAEAEDQGGEAALVAAMAVNPAAQSLLHQLGKAPESKGPHH